ncbi:MAG TPA: Twin-arginine translocation pathway signal [Streptomyces sp.]|nr:Twin-arginine translocation pathway signal [Streptomyces sp.]
MAVVTRTSRVTRARRAEIQREAAHIRREGQRRGHRTEEIATAIRAALPEVLPLEAWRLALGWSRAEAIEQIAARYHEDGLMVPGLNASMMCRWEHGDERPGPEYAAVIPRAYGARPEQLGLTRHRSIAFAGPSAANLRYGRPDRAVRPRPSREEVEPMTTAAGLPAVRESVHLALLADPNAGAPVIDAAQTAVEHYALNYSKHPPHVLFSEVRRIRELLTVPLAVARDEQRATELRRVVGWLSALLGNAAYHLGDHTGAHVHLTTAAALGDRTGDARLAAWAYGAQSMIARARGRLEQAVELAERGLSLAPGSLARAQLLGWALLPALARQGRGQDADETLAAAEDALAADPIGSEPGRFGYDAAEHALHQAEAHLALGRFREAAALAETSAGRCVTGTPGWAAATLLHAQAEATDQPGDATERALAVLGCVPAGRLRATSRARLAALDEALIGSPVTAARDLHERLQALPAPIDPHGRPGTTDDA